MAKMYERVFFLRLMRSKVGMCTYRVWKGVRSEFLELLIPSILPMSLNPCMYDTIPLTFLAHYIIAAHVLSPISILSGLSSSIPCCL